MGLFSGERTITVDSVVYNMAGDEQARPNYLRSLITRNVLSGTQQSIAESLQNGYLHGPATQFRKFYRWSQRPGNYDQIGTPNSVLSAGNSIASHAVENVLADVLGVEATTLWVQQAFVDRADASMWAEQFILSTKPAKWDTAWSAVVDQASGFAIVITYDDLTTDTLTPSNFVNNAKYLYAYYNVKTGSNYSGTRLYIYQIGSGNADLDALVNNTDSYGQFFPFIPVRLNNVFLSESFQPAAYHQCKKAYKKLTGDSFDKLVKKINANPKIADIDFAFVVPGVSLNVKENACKKYIYAFFQKLQASQVGGVNLYNSWQNTYTSEQGIRTTWETWKVAQDDTSSSLYGTTEPPRPTMQTMPFNEIRITNAGVGSVFTDYDIRIGWIYVANGSGTGLAKAGAKKDELWFEILPSDEVVAAAYSDNATTRLQTSYQIPKVRLYWQRDETLYTYLDIVGANHANYIYGDKGIVAISADQALRDPEESGFIVPLHYDTYHDTAMVPASQMATAACFLVFNCYTVKKSKWYTSSVFAVILVVVIAIVSAVFTGGASIGILGSALAVGSAVGLSGMAAIIAGATINAIVGMIVATLVTNLATGIFGDQIGGLIATVAMLFIGQVSSQISATGTFSFSTMWGDLMKADTLMHLTDALGKGVSGLVNGDSQKLGAELQDFTKMAQNESKKIQQAFYSEFGTGNSGIDPLMFVADSSKILTESSDTFLTRTLMTGSDIAELSKDLLNNFSEYSLKLENAFT